MKLLAHSQVIELGSLHRGYKALCISGTVLVDDGTGNPREGEKCEKSGKAGTQVGA